MRTALTSMVGRRSDYDYVGGVDKTQSGVRRAEHAPESLLSSVSCAPTLPESQQACTVKIKAWLVWVR